MFSAMSACSVQCLHVQCNVCMFSAMSTCSVQCLHVQCNVYMFSAMSTCSVQCLHVQCNVCMCGWMLPNCSPCLSLGACLDVAFFLHRQYLCFLWSLPLSFFTSCSHICSLFQSLQPSFPLVTSCLTVCLTCSHPRSADSGPSPRSSVSLAPRNQPLASRQHTLTRRHPHQPIRSNHRLWWLSKPNHRSRCCRSRPHPVLTHRLSSPEARNVTHTVSRAVTYCPSFPLCVQLY